MIHDAIDRMAADFLPRAAEAVTGVRSKFPRFGRAALLAHADPRVVPLAYVRSSTPAKYVDWVHYSSVQEAGGSRLPLPGLFRAVTRSPITDVGMDALDAADYDMTYPAVMWSLADAAMVGVLTSEQTTKLLETDKPALNMLLGAHPQGLDVGIAVFNAVHGSIITSRDWLDAGWAMPLLEFEHDEPIW